MENPFEIILERLDRIEKAIQNLSVNGSLVHASDPMDVKDLAAYLKISASTIYKFTSTRSLPYYKMARDSFLKEKKLMIGFLRPR